MCGRVSVIGPAGAGKSTLARRLAHLLTAPGATAGRRDRACLKELASASWRQRNRLASVGVSTGMGALTRRGFVMGGSGALAMAACGLGYELVMDGTLPGKYQLDRLLGSCGGDPGIPSVTPGAIVASRFASRYRRCVVEMVIMHPPGRYGPLPAANALHGAGGSARSAISLGYPQYLAAAVARGDRPFAVVSVDGGGSAYWHRRVGGDDPAGMIVHEVLPRLRNHGYQAGPVALTGWSMGGYGALLLASMLGPGQVAAVAASSAAVFGSYADAIAASPGSFDSPADFAASDIRSPHHLSALRRIPTRIDCGSDDPFAAQDHALRAALGDPAGTISGGCHDQAFWRRALSAQLTFLSQHLGQAHAGTAVDVTGPRLR